MNDENVNDTPKTQSHRSRKVQLAALDFLMETGNGLIPHQYTPERRAWVAATDIVRAAADSPETREAVGAAVYAALGDDAPVFPEALAVAALAWLESVEPK
ncbi:MAG: hypothetical protein RBT62_11420 [Spirochaetia bacterium]|jgi:hypothetical protein|nr:hypothetical protein [Spirochaetia bacterium]